MRGDASEIKAKNNELKGEKMKLDSVVNEKTENYRQGKQLRDFLDSLTYDINAAETEMRKLVNRVGPFLRVMCALLILYHLSFRA